jgi:PAS domain S-box-containing protein
VQSTPIITREGRLLGMFSTHYRTPRPRSERDLRLVNLLAAQAADLIERFRAEEALRNEREQLESITDNMPAAVTRCSRDFRYLWVSRAYANSLRRSKEEIEGRSIRDVIGEQGFEELRPFMERVLTGERVEYSAEVHYQGVGGRWVHAVYIPKRTRDQFVEGWTAVVTDITESVNQEQRLRAANLRLSRANEDLSHFAFAASHDLLEPLRMIATYSELLLRGYRGQPDEEASMYMRFIGEGTKRMQQLLADLLAYTRLVGDGPEPIASLVDLNAAFAKALENCQASVEETGANVTNEPLPSVRGYEAHFVELFQNLISNALKYRSDQPPRVHVSATQENGEWRIGVTDNGIGIEPEYHRMIFGVFKRLHDRTIPGTGIGLAICQRVVERYGGRIWVDSQKNHGATFYFSLPAGQAALAHDS